MGRDLDETDPLQPLQCFAHRRARDAQPLGQIVVAEALAGSEAAVEDRLAQARVYLVTENGAAGNEGGEGDGHVRPVYDRRFTRMYRSANDRGSGFGGVRIT
jgi:hypothetical protein